MPALKAASAQNALPADHMEELAPVLEALDCLRVAITIFDSSETLVYANRHFGYLFRSLPRALLGRKYEELIRLEISGGEISDPRVLADPDVFVAERRIQLQDSEFAPRDIALADGRFIEIKARRTPSGFAILLWSDVTAARHHYGRLEDAIALSAEAFAFFDSRDRFVLGNDEYAKLAGVPDAAQLEGQTFTEIVTRAIVSGPFAIEGKIEDWMKHRLEGHRSPAAAYTLTARSSGTAYLVRDRATRDGGRAVVFTDITDEKRVEAALVEQTRALDQTRNALAQSETEARRQATYLADLTTRLDALACEADTTKTTLLRTMSHELKTPLNAILGFSDLMGTMADRLNPDQVREYSALIHQGGTNLLKLLNQIMDLTKMAAGRYELRRTSIDVGAALWLVRENFGPRAEAKSITLNVECPKGIVIEADENAVTAMVTHLIDNAVNFTQEGGAVRVCVERADSHVRVSVSDNGPGVRAADLARILEPFEQAGRGTTDHAAGAGLGLTLVKAFAELQGGRLQIASVAGQGFTAEFELPAPEALTPHLR
jgi:two-component system cell cycle sensor histidine kinase PleC